jgi:hypothetical protein
MTLALIGAGFGRTGTASLKIALEKLGLGRCYHMIEVFGNPAHAPLWHAAASDPRIAWDGPLAGYSATVDWPGCFFWRELADRYPDAKVLLSVREPGSWHRSVMDTIYHPLIDPPAVMPPGWSAMVRDLILDRTFDGRLDDRDHAIAVYQHHNEAVKQAIAPQRLLVYEASQGWEPLCRFLDKPLPAEPFPRVNTTDEWRARMAAATQDHAP